MKRLWAVASSRALTPLVLGFFLLLYVGIAFVTDEALIVLIAITKRFPLLVLLFALIPLNMACRLVNEVLAHLKLRRAVRGESGALQEEMFDERVEVPSPPSSFGSLGERLRGLGYRTCATEAALTARRGISLFPARLLFQGAMVALFTGILLSLGTRTTGRSPIIEGEPLPAPSGDGGIVERIDFADAPGPFLAKTLRMRIAPSTGEGERVFGLYPPDRYAGAFVYPRYLGIGLHFRFTAPDLAGPATKSAVLNLYPPGKEGASVIEGTPYRIIFSLEQPQDGTDPYVTGRMSIRFKVVKKDEAVFTGSVPAGGQAGNGIYQVAIPDVRRVVLTDFIRDGGVPLIWFAAAMLLLGTVIWLPVRLFAPFREMAFIRENGNLVACSLAEGNRRKHGENFHEALDVLISRSSTEDAF